MGAKQTLFLEEFKSAFGQHFGREIKWDGGQAAENTAGLITHISDRRPVGLRTTERFELGDATTKYRGWKIIIEFESRELPLSNILKYWPYMRGELGTAPREPILLCHFSDWGSYATRRDLWEWTLSRMRVDSERLVDIEGRQFDHGGKDNELRIHCISSAIHWIASVVDSSPRRAQ